MKRAQLRRYPPGSPRTQAVIAAFYAVLRTGTETAAVTYEHKYREELITTTYVLVAVGWNPTYAGTDQVLVVRDPDGPRHSVHVIPFTRLISITAQEDPA